LVKPSKRLSGFGQVLVTEQVGETALSTVLSVVVPSHENTSTTGPEETNQQQNKSGNSLRGGAKVNPENVLGWTFSS
jgi:hypothetical protein